MLGIVKEINGEKKIIPLTTDTGTGAPVGTLITQYKKVPMSGYLYCDGSRFDENVYPALYMYLGKNELPDYRECVMVGAEQNTTDTISAHDVYAEGEFKDDQLQDHTHAIYNTNPGGTKPESPIEFTVDNGSAGFPNKLVGYAEGARAGTTTHGKQKAVYVYIKATSGLAENQQENVLNDVKYYVDDKIDDTTTSDTKVWSSSKTLSEITKPHPGKEILPLSTIDTEFSLSQGESLFYGRLLQIDGHVTENAETMVFLILVKANYNNPTEVYAQQIAGLYNTGTDSFDRFFELGVSSNNTLTIKNKSNVIAMYRIM